VFSGEILDADESVLEHLLSAEGLLEAHGDGVDVLEAVSGTEKP